MKIFFIFLLLFVSKTCNGQGFSIKEMKETVSGADAFHAPIDTLGRPCGLIKVLTTYPDLEFEGQIVGNVIKDINEYHVFMMKGANELLIKRPHILPLVVSFNDYGIEVASKATYQIVLKDLKINNAKNHLIISTKPQKAKLYVNNMLIDNTDNGGYQLLLPKGEYALRIELEGYRPQTQICKIGKEANVLNIELESVMANLEVNCSTSGADLIINGEKKATGNWKGELPAGNYVIEAQKKGFLSATKRILLEEKDKKTILIPELERKKTSILVKTIPVVCDIYIDGALKGKSGERIDAITTGEHLLELVPKFGYAKIEEIFDIGEDLVIERTFNPSDDIYRKAFDGDTNSQMTLAMKYEKKGFDTAISTQSVIVDIEQSDYWYAEAYKTIQKASDEVFLRHCKQLIYYNLYVSRPPDPSKALKLYLRKGKIEGHYENMNIERCYALLNQWDKAIEWIKKEISKKDEPDFAYSLYDLYAMLGSCYAKSEDYDNALLWYNTAKEEKLKDYRKYMSTDDYTYKVYCITTYGMEIADIYVRKNDIKKAVELYRQLKGKFVDDPAGKKLKELGYY